MRACAWRVSVNGWEMPRIFGSAQCRNSGVALRWARERGLSPRFYDTCTGGIDEQVVNSWIDAFGWQAVIDKRTIAWRAQASVSKHALERDQALKLILDLPQLLKSPIIAAGDAWLLGWNAANKVRLLGNLRSLSSAGARDSVISGNPPAICDPAATQAEPPPLPISRDGCRTEWPDQASAVRGR